jgi:hypothetical protein
MKKQIIITANLVKAENLPQTCRYRQKVVSLRQEMKK